MEHHHTSVGEGAWASSTVLCGSAWKPLERTHQEPDPAGQGLS